ncbi:MAG TPA: ankyrin repeat domain-containing protein [Pyrinomonadaceae bacterium]|jgi:ankyrin repeat protein|nr:ankyrin repeat domain-containing protein [Pyrinomonadaceae bacterium]
MKRFLLILWLAFLAACATVPAPSGDSQAASSRQSPAPGASSQTETQSPDSAAIPSAIGQQTAAPPRAISEDERQQLSKALLQAAEAGETAKVSAFISRGADVNAINSIRVQGSPLTALMLAVVHNHLETARVLLDKGAHVNATADFPDGGPTVPQKGVTALMQASASGNLPMVKLLVEHGADVNAKDGDGVTALMGTTDGEVVAYLLEHKADPNVKDKDGNTALINVARNSRFGDPSSIAAAKALLSKGADVSAGNKDGETALSVAEQTGKDELVALFKKAGAR